MIVLDTSLLFALLDRRDDRHDEAAVWYAGAQAELATTPLVVAETDHLAARRAGSAALRAFRRDLAAGAYLVDWWPGAQLEMVEIAERYRDLALSLTDASLVALAARFETIQIATFDEQHFRAVRPLSGGRAFALLPADA